MVNLTPSLSQVLVVPPFECAWLAGENFLLRDGTGCVSFEVKGDNDVTVIFKPECGSRRWQHLTAKHAAERALSGRESPVEPNYTVILGSHRNSCLKFEKNGELCHTASNVPGSKLSSTAFTKFWVSCDGRSIAVGIGQPSALTTCYRWVDDEPIEGIRFVGLSAWDKHVGYRNIAFHPAIDFTSLAAGNGNLFYLTTSTQIQTESLLTLVELSCRAALELMAPDTICSILAVTDSIAPIADGLRARAIEAAALHFPTICAKDPKGFAELTVVTLREILQHQNLACSETAVFDAVSNCWARRGPTQGLQPGGSPGGAAPGLHEVELLLPHIRFPLMSSEELEEISGHLLASQSQLLRDLLAEARCSAPGDRLVSAPSVRADRLVQELSPLAAAASARYQRRAPISECNPLIYMYDGDYNGVFWHIGTRYGTQKWVNPAVAGLVTVAASSPVIRGTDPKALVGRTFARHNFAGPRRDPMHGGLCAWWAVDLGQGHALECNYYTLRSDGSSNFLRNWALQGSHDGHMWVDIRRHERDLALTLPGQYASWAVGGKAAMVPYRHFRILLLAPDPEATNPYHICLSHMELYGNFRVAS